MPHQFHAHEHYIEVRLQGALESVLEFSPEVLARVRTLKRVLIDLSDITEVVADAYVLAEQAHRIEELGLKVAVYAPRPALFGLNRQVLQLGLVREGVSASVFSDIEQARAWLTA